MSNVRDFGAVGDGVADDTEAIQHAVADGEGIVEFPRGNYRVSKTILVDLSKESRTSVVEASRKSSCMGRGRRSF